MLSCCRLLENASFKVVDINKNNLTDEFRVKTAGLSENEIEIFQV